MMTSTRPTPTSRGDGAFPRRARRAPAWAAIATIVALFLNLAQGILPGTSAPVAAQAGSVPTAAVPAVVAAPAAPVAVMALGGPPFIYFVPLPEDQIKASYDSIQKNGSTYRAATFITAAVNGTVIIYDQWEDGYEANLASPVQASTRIFGDGNPANGDADTYCSASCAGDIINAGDVLVLSANQTLTIPRNPGDVKFDGKDKFSANYPVAGGRAYWPTDAGPLMAEAGQFYSTDDYGTSFVMPVGENLSAYSYEAFERVAAFIMAGANQTKCTYNGSALSPLNEGQSVRVPAVQTGDALVCDKPVQVHLITGDTGSNYEVRAFEAFARNTWTNSYYDPVSTVNTSYPAANYVYNPHAAALTVRAETRFGTTSFSVPANGVTRYTKPDSAVHLFSSDGRDFYALNVNDAADSNVVKNQTYDWGHPLIPESLLTTMMVSGWAPGSEDGTPPNGNPVWVTALGDTTLYIDYDADPATGALTDSNGNHYDATLALTRLQSARVYDTADNDQTGLRLYTLSGVKISGAWGEDGSRAKVARPNIDAGTVSLPFPVPSLNKSVELATDGDSDGQYDPGDIARYRIVVRNAGGQPLVNVRVEDTLPAGVAYVAGSTTLDGAPVADDAGAFPLLAANGGLALPDPAQAPGTVPAGAQYVIEFRVTIQAAAAGSVLTNTAFLFSSAQNLQASADITVPPSTITACTLNFTDNGGINVSFVLEGGQLYVTVADGDHNLNVAVQETLGVVVRNVTDGDVESLVLRETGVSSGVFRNTAGLPVSITAGVAAQDGTLNARVGQTLQADYQDALFGDTCSDTLLMAGPTQSKVLYLSEPGQGLDRVDPVAAGDTTTATSEALGIASAATIAVDNISSALNAAAVATIAVDASASAINDAAPPLAVDNTSYGTLNNASSTSFSHTTGSGSNRLMLVGVSCQQPGASITALTYNGVSLTKVGNLSNSSQTRVEIWRLIAPASGAHTVAVTNSQGDNCVIGVTTFAGVHQTTPLGTFVSAQASSATASVTASSATGELVFAAAGFNNGSTNLTPGGSQTEYWDQTVNSSIAGAGGTKAGASSVPMSWTSATSASWTIGAVPVKPAGTGGSTAGVTIPSFTTGSGSNRLMLVGVSIDLSSSSAAVSSVAYGAQSLTLVGTATNTGNERMELWRLVNPSSGTANIVVTMNGQAHNGIVAGATTFTGVDQTTPLGAFASATGTSTTPSVNVTSASGELVFAAVAAGQGVTFSAVGAGQTSRWNATDAADIAGAASTEAGAASVTMSWTSSNVPWAIGGVPIKPAGFATATAGVTLPSFTTGSGSNRLMLVGVSIDLNSASAAVSSVAYGAQSLTLVGAATNTGNERMELWRLVAPTAGTANITVTLNGQAHNGIVAGVTTFTGVDQTTPLGTFASATGTSTTPSVNVTSASGELVFAVAAAGQATTFSAVGAGQTSRWNATDSADIAGAASTEAGAASVTMSWTSSSVPWAIGGVSLKPAAAGSGVTSTDFTQAQPMTSDFVMPAGGLITVTNYVSTTGTLAANPAITATLKSNGATFATLTNPTATLVSAGGPTAAYKVGSFTKSTSTGNQVITHNLGVTPKAIILWTAGNSTGSPTAHYHYAQGFSDGSTSYSFSAASQDAVGTSNSGRRFAAKALTIIEYDATTTLAEADLASWTSTSLTLTWTTNNASAYIVHYMIIGGADVSAKVVNWTAPTATGNKSATGVGFQPDLVLHMSARGLTASAPANQISAAFFSGAMNAAGQQWSNGFFSQDAQTTSLTRRNQRTDRALLGFSNGAIGSAPTTLASYVSMDVGGFTLNFDATAGADQIASLALRGMSSKVGSFDKITTTGNQAITGVGFRPEAVFVSSAGITGANQTVRDQNRHGWGASDGVTQGSSALNDEDAQATSVVKSMSSNSSIYTKLVATLQAQASLSSLDSDGFTLNWTNNTEAASPEMLYLALDAPVTSSIYRLDWNAVLASNTTVATGQAVNLTVTSGITSTLQVLYDSSTYPSQVSLPTNTVIKVDSLGIYNAPYPGGSLVTTTSPGQTLYIRSQISDPFGADDISGASLNISGTLVSLTAGNVVTTAAAGKTYETAWFVPLGTCQDIYPVSITANEGTEGITATAKTEILSVCSDDGGTQCAAHFLTAPGGAIVSEYGVGDTVYLRVVDFDQNLNPAVAETLTATLDSVIYTLTETGVNTGVFEAADSTIADGQLVQLVYLDPNTPLPGADVCTAEAAAGGGGGAAAPNLAVIKRLTQPASGPALVGDVIRFSLLVVNTGDEILNPVVITDTFDSSKLQYVSASLAPTGSAANSRTWNNLGPLAPNARTTIEIVFLALAPAQPTVNSATATGTPLSGPNITKSSSASVNIFGPKLGLTKTILTPADRQAVVGANVTFQIVMSNTGDSVIDVLPLVDNFDAVCLTYVSANPAPSATGNGTLFWSDLTLTFAQNLGVGQQFTLNVTLRTLEACDPAVNSATVEFARDINGNQVPPVAGFDFVQTRVVYDFGDLPDSYGTLLTSNGARHALSLFRPLQMGAAAPDAENDGQPDATATGDDLAGTPDDEDGVTLPTFIVGQSATVVVTVTNSTGVTATLYGFIDFNGDGSFGAGEMVTRTVAHNTNGPLALPFSVPANAHTSQPVGARFRMSTAGGLTAVGLAPDGEVEDYLVQINKLARIGDFVWHDQDGDRIQDPGEPGIGGVTVVLTNSLGVTFITTTVAGVYEFPNLPAGTYTVTLDTTTVPPEYNYITTPARYVVNLTLGQTFLDADFGLQTLATVIGDYIWYDADADGVQDVGEPGIGNVTLALYRDDGDGVFEPGPGLGRDTFVGSTVSDSAGAYALRAFGAGTYFVDVTDDNGLLAGLNHTIGPQSLAEPSPPIIVQAGDIYRDADFGYVLPTAPGMAVIGDLVWVDGNRNGVREIAEPILIGVEVCAAPLAGGTGGGCDITDLDGRYLLLVPAGAYSVAPTAPPLGLTPSTAVPHVVTVASGQQYLDADFGYYGSMVALGGTIWQDLPDAGDLTDGVYSPATEPGIPNVSVNVIQDRNADGIWDTGEPIVATVSNTGGDYLFDSLLPGAYLAQVSDTLAVLRRFAVTTLGPNPGQDFNNQRQPYSVTLGAGQTNTTADFGYREYDAVGQGDPPDPGVIGDQIWYDVKEDGVYRPVDGDQAIAGVTLALRQDGAAYATITTGGYGQYLFTNLPLGHTYTVSVTDLFGVLRGFNVTTPGPNPGQNNNNQAQPYSVVLGVQRDNRTADFGYTWPVVIGDWVYFDVNGNGLADAGEPGIPAVTLDVYRGGVQLASATTNAAGMYTVTGPADTYTITVAAAELAPGGTLYGWTPTVTPTMPLTLGAGQVITTADFGFTIPSGYTVTKRLNTPDPVRPGEPISYTIRITNTGATWITALQLTDAFSETYLTYGFGGVFASLDSDDHITDGLLTWADVLSVGRGGPGMLAPGASLAVIVTFTGRSDTHAAGSAGTQNVAIIQDGRFDPDGPAGGLAARAVPSVPPASADAYVQIFTPTGLPIANFRAAAGAGGVTLTWQTNTEAQFLGFNVLHKLADGAYRVVNPELIIAAHSGANAGATYSLRDAGAPAGSQSYLLEVLWLDGRTQRVGPVKVTVTPSGLTP